MCLYSESLLVSLGSTALFVPKITRQPFPRASELLLTPMTSLLNKLPPLFAVLGPRNRNGGRVCSRPSRSNCYQVVFPREQIKSQRLALSWGKSYRGTVSRDVSTQLSQELEDEYFGAAGQYGQSLRASLHTVNQFPAQWAWTGAAVLCITVAVGAILSRAMRERKRWEWESFPQTVVCAWGPAFFLSGQVFWPFLAS